MNYNEAAKTIAEATAAIKTARRAFDEAVRAANGDETMSDYGRKLAREEASQAMAAAVEGLPDAIEEAAEVINEAVRVYNESFDVKDEAVRDAVAFAQYPNLPEVAVMGLVNAIKRPSEARYISGVLKAAGNDDGAVLAATRAEALTARPVINATDAWFIAHELGEGVNTSPLDSIASQASAAESIMSAADE